MSAKRKNEAKDPDVAPRRERTKTFVTFRNGHMHLDVKGFLSSREGRESVQKVIQLSNGLPQKKRDKDEKKPATAT